MTADSWIVVAGHPEIGSLIAAARSLGGQVSAVVAGPRALADLVAAAGVDRVVWFGDPGQVPVEGYASAVADVVRADPRMLFGGRHPGERVLLGAAAAALQAPVLTGAHSILVEDGEVVVTHAVYGGIADETVAVSGPVALMLDGGPMPTAIGSAVVEELAVIPFAIRVTESRSSTFTEAELGSAPRVVGVGRGLRTQQGLVLIEDLARALEAEVACSRPLAEGLNWMGKDRYIGISGQHIAPRLYLAIGISGQLQHMAGVRGAETIVAINSDPEAPVFQDADYGIVGDLYEIVPTITRALK